MNVVYSSSDTYSICTGVSLWSLYENNKMIDKLNVYILSTDISEKNKKRLEAVANNFGRTIEIIDAKQDFIDEAKRLNLKLLRGAYNTYSRVVLNRWFSHLDKIMVIDSDTLVCGDISGAWKINMEGKLVAAVPEVAMYGENNNLESPDLLNSIPVYYNMGICVVNLQEWRRLDIDACIAQRIQEETEEFKIADQSIINKYINEKMVRLPLKYNYYSVVHGIKYETICNVFNKKSIFTVEEYEEAKQEPAIIHYFGHSYERPWFKYNAAYENNRYLQVLSKTPWASEPLAKWRKNNSLIFEGYDRVCYLLLKCGFRSTCLKFKYIWGQKLKGILGMSR